MLAIHPSHVPVINEEFGCGDHEMRRDVRLVEAMCVARAEVAGAASCEGRMIDHAMSCAAAERLRKWGNLDQVSPDHGGFPPCRPTHGDHPAQPLSAARNTGAMSD